MSSNSPFSRIHMVNFITIIGIVSISSFNVRAEQATCAAGTGSLSSDEIRIEQFSDPSFGWTTMNDPVMGGASTSSLTIFDGTAVLEGNVADIPFLGVPGFVTMTARGFTGYPDVSCCDALALTVMTVDEYEGYRVSFGMARAEGMGYAMGYKADFSAPVGEFGEVTIPFNKFSVKWDEATGDQIVTCEEDPAVCPDVDTLRNMQTIALWGEGVGGDLQLHVASIRATGCSKQQETIENGEGTTLSFKDADESSSCSTRNCSTVIGVKMLLTVLMLSFL